MGITTIKKAFAMCTVSMMLMLSTTFASLAEVNVSETSASVCVLINKEREKNGLKLLKWNDRLAQDASVRGREATVSWSHTRPNGTDWWTLDPECMYGEILAKNYDTAEDVVNAWMESPTHKEEILRSDITDMGLAMVKGSEGWYYAVEFM